MSQSHVQVAAVFHSGYRHTAKQAEAVARGAAFIGGVSAELVNVNGGDRPWARLEAADAIIFGWPLNIGGPSTQIKVFQDASSAVFAAGGKCKDKIAAGFTNSASHSGDKLAMLQQFAIFAAQHGMHWVHLGLPPANNWTKGSEADANRLGFFLGAAAQSNAVEGPHVAPPSADLLSAEHLGRRVATVALKNAQAARPEAPLCLPQPNSRSNPKGDAE